MERKLLAILFFSLIGSQNVQSKTYKILHYNIKELASFKLKASPQFEAVKKVLNEILGDQQADIYSINEIQYDLPGVPNEEFQTQGENLKKLADLIGIGGPFYTTFNRANTGNNARRKPDGSYPMYPGEPGGRGLADTVNFGVFPSQYSTGGISRHPIIKETVFTKLRWKDFYPKAEIEKYAQENGQPLPQEMELFDKNFTDAVMELDGKKLHVILLHTVPAYHFGNPKSPNYIRNRDQLRFLEWYTTGSTDIEVPKDIGIKPLGKDESFVIVGDLNSDIENQENPGSAVLRRLATKTKQWVPVVDFTNESQHFGPKPFQLRLDYMFFSRDIEVVKGAIYRPGSERMELGCGVKSAKNAKDDPSRSKVIVEYKHKNSLCFSAVNQDYYYSKVASDHFPIWAEFRWVTSGISQSSGK